MTLEEALRKTLYAYNNQVRKSGVSPSQIVYGRQFPFSGIVNGPPASDEPLIKEDLRQQVVRRVLAEETFRKYEADEKVKRILAQETRSYQNHVLQPGEEIFFKEESRSRWSGPAKIISMESSKIRVNHD